MWKEDPDDHRIAQAIRDLILRACPQARENLAEYAVGYMRSYINAYLSRRRYGFMESFSQVSQEVSDSEVANLLAPALGQAGDGPPVLLARLQRIAAGRRGGVRPEDALPEDDLTLRLVFHKVLRLRSRQGLEHAWREQHPQEHSLLRRFKELCRSSTDCRLHDGPLGRVIVTPRSDLKGRPLNASEVREHLASQPGARPRAILSRLVRLLEPDSQHGGYCFLMDLVREVHQDRVRRFQVWWEDLARSRSGSPILCFGRTSSMLLDETQRSLRVEAEKILDGNRHKTSRSVREAWMEVAVDAVLRGFGISEQTEPSTLDGGRWSQRRSLEHRLGEAFTPETADFHMQQTTYLISRLRSRWEGK